MRLDGGFRHLRALIDDVGIWQHASGAAPAAEHGYCLDDAARAAMVTARLVLDDPSWRHERATCCRFIDAAMAPSGGARNFRDAAGEWLDRPHAGDHVGRTVWALGALTGDTDPAVREWATDRLDLLADGDLLASCGFHGRLYALLGLVAADRPSLVPLACEQLAAVMARIPDDAAWRWPEPRVRYDAGRVPEALLRAGVALRVEAAVDTGCAVLHWLTELVVQDSGVHRYPGHLGYGPDDDLDASGDEQPLEPAAFAAAHAAAYDAVGAAVHRHLVHDALAWYHGANRLGLSLIDPVTEACHDGLGREDRNHNQGAESSLAYAATRILVGGLAR